MKKIITIITLLIIFILVVIVSVEMHRVIGTAVLVTLSSILICITIGVKKDTNRIYFTRHE